MDRESQLREMYVAPQWKRFSLLCLPMKVQITMARREKYFQVEVGGRLTTPGIKSVRKKSRKVKHK